MPVRMAKAAGDLVHLGLDRLQVRHPERVDLLRCRVEAGLDTDGNAISLLAVGRRPDARFGAGMRLVLVDQVVTESPQPGVQVLLDTGHQARAILVGHGRQSTGGMGVRRQGKQALDLLDGAPHRHRSRRTAVPDAFVQRLDVLLDHCWIGRVADEELFEALRGVRGLVLRVVGGPYLRAGHVVDGELVPLVRQLLEVVLADEDDQIAGDDLLRFEPVGRDPARFVQRRSVGRLIGGAASRAEIGPAVVVALVAEEGRPHRIPLQDALPEPVGEVVDGSVGIDGDGHGRVLPLRARARAEWPV